MPHKKTEQTANDSGKQRKNEDKTACAIETIRTQLNNNAERQEEKKEQTVFVCGFLFNASLRVSFMCQI